MTAKKLQLGKLPIETLKKTMLRFGGAHSDLLVTGPRAGLDFGAVKVGNQFLIVSVDPITSVSSQIGRYAVIVSANDVATSGNRPQFAESVVLLPEGSTENDAGRIGRQMHDAARALGVAIVGGHTEVTPGLKRPILTVTAFSLVEDFITSAQAREGDAIMMTKTAGIEGTAVLSGDDRLLKDLSIVDEAVAGYETGHARAMHDCTEGGLLGAVFEMSMASGIGFQIEEGLVPVSMKTAELCRRLSIDPLRLIGSGSLLLAVKPGKEEGVANALEGICKATVVGRFTRGGGSLVRRDGRRLKVGEAPEDELWTVLGRPL